MSAESVAMKRWSRRSVLAGLVVLPARGWAHAGHPASAWLRSAQWDHEALRLVVLVLNESDSEVTLRGVTCPGVRTLVFAQRRSLLGVAVERRVEALRLGPNELVRLGDERYRLELAGIDPAATELALMLDFGPQGTVPLTVPVPPRS